MCRAISFVCFSSLAKSPITWQKSHFCPNAAANAFMVGIKFSSAGSNFKFFGAGCCPNAATARSNAVKISLIANYYDTRPPLELPTYIVGMSYTVILEQELDNGFVASVPALPGCISQGDTREQVMANIGEAIALYIEDCIAAGDEVPLGEGIR
jgi:predicted RNase H-like HicB family nuclease